MPGQFEEKTLFEHTQQLLDPDSLLKLATG